MAETLRNNPSEIWDRISQLQADLIAIIDIHKPQQKHRRYPNEKAGKAIKHTLQDFLASVHSNLPEELYIGGTPQIVLDTRKLELASLTEETRSRLPESIWVQCYFPVIRAVERSLLERSAHQAA